MRLTLLILTLALAPTLIAHAQAKDPCADLRRSLNETYDFRPALLSEQERAIRIAAMDKFWKTVEARPKALLPCLRAALEEPRAVGWFGVSGSNLLVSLDPSRASKALQVRHYTAANLDDMHLPLWVMTLSERGAEGFDVSEAGARWLVYPRAWYFLPLHSQKVDAREGALYIFGSMDEAKATPALMKIVKQADHPAREDALWIVMNQATPESLRALKELRPEEIPEARRDILRRFLENPPLVRPRPQPKTTREQFLHALETFANGIPEGLMNLIEEVPDGERDMVAVLKPEDLPVVRRARRVVITRANRHATELYHDFTRIIMTLMLESEPPGGVK